MDCVLKKKTRFNNDHNLTDFHCSNVDIPSKKKKPNKKSSYYVHRKKKVVIHINMHVRIPCVDEKKKKTGGQTK